ncbi:hypothetical protein [Motilimonas pumila]|uniref:Uncharacterized protein n=1 Tax=Motilimonas pumila TaxID=2303987 RepID=A0A418YEE0_9GAMM|nr:hypothetical protein [Motilimonas pumila]RJG47479.1 hypothetical protein D1Z90_11240 [Motilimonas pumila]
MKIDWHIPAPRKGVTGSIDKFIGPGATSAEKSLQLWLPILAGIALLACGYGLQWHWSIWQFVVATILMVDMVGGVITNSTSSAKRWFHRPGQGVKQHITFILTHFVQLGLFAWTFMPNSGFWLMTAGGFLVAASAIILISPLYLQRTVAACCYLASLMLSFYVLAPALELAWFLPLFYFKLLICHLLKEAPFRPENE